MLGKRPAATAGPLDARVVALMRCLLAVSALLVLVFDPYQARFPIAVYAVLVAYCVYAVALCVALLGGLAALPARSHHWIDVAVFAVLASLGDPAAGVFYPLFLFAILCASFTRGFREGFAVTVASVALFAAACFGMESEASFDDLVTRPVYLLVLGYMMAYWGGHEIALRQRLRLLKDVAGPANPRLGIDHAMAQSLRRVREYFSASDCVLVCRRGERSDYVMYRVGAGAQPRALTAASAQALLALPPTRSLAWSRGGGGHDAETQRACERLANLLEAPAFLSVPYRQLQALRGRLFLTGERRFAAGDAEFLEQVIEQLASAIDNLALMDTVMAKAAQLERARISRDIHDTTVQPYIGLKLGLEALHRALPADSPARRPVAELLAMADAVVEDLRGYVARLRGDEGEDARWPGEHLVAGLREHLDRYCSFYGIEVQLRSDAVVQLSDRVAGEAYQIVCEALSNIHRHTAAKRAFVELKCGARRLAIEVGNECDAARATPAFTPRTISERATALGGTAEVRLGHAGYDVVRVAIPL